MNIIGGKPGHVKMVLQIKRKDTGKVDEVTLVGTIIPKEKHDNNSIDRSTQRGN